MRCATGRIRAISALRRRSPGSPALKPRRAFLTNLHTDLDFETLRKLLPESVEPGYDGLKIVL